MRGLAIKRTIVTSLLISILLIPAIGWCSDELKKPSRTMFEAVPRFGAKLFTGAKAPSVTDGEVASTGAPVPAGYVLGPADALTLEVWARDFKHIDEELVVSPDGKVTLPQLGKFSVSGRSLQDVRETLRSRYGNVFTEPDVVLEVSAQRTVEIYVTGDVVKPGKYRLSGMATVLRALYEAGGPSEIGSYREIRLLRPGRQDETIDLYEYLLHGRGNVDMLLNSGDTIFVPPLQTEAAVQGAVRRPARYELNAGATIETLIRMAGGLQSTAYGPVVQLWRTADRREWILQTVDAADPESPDLDVPVRDGDMLVVEEILPGGDNVAKVYGAVKRPGYYPVHAETTVGSLLRAAEGLSGDAHMEQGVLTRLDDQRHVQMTTFDVRKQYYGDEEAQIPVRPKDWVRIFYQDEVEPDQIVQVQGAVKNPDTYEWMENMRVSDLVMQAGGLVPNAHTDRANLLRLTPAQSYEMVPVNLYAALGGDTDADIVLKRGDILQVKLQEEAGEAATVHVAGFVRDPGDYTRYEGMRVSDLIFEAGGLKPGAGPTVEVIPGRYEGRPDTRKLTLRGGPGDYDVSPDMTLGDDDTVAVAGRGDFSAKANLISVEGQVKHPGAYAIKSAPSGRDYTVYDLLQEAGGLLEDANKSGLVVYRLRDISIAKAQSEDLERVLSSVNRETRQKPFQVDEDEKQQAMGATVAGSIQSVLSTDSSVNIVLPPHPVKESDWVTAIPVDGQKLLDTKGESGDLALSPGDTVYVPRIVNTVTILGAVPRSGAVPYVEGATCGDYLDESGGLREDAAAERMIVVHANGAAAPVGRSAAVEPGDVIVVPTKHIVRTVRTEGKWEQWLKGMVGLITAALVF
ncbi:MAG: SLBB domain-containing protein [Armatimonadota bacterium]